ncbi:MAG: hypothetical protein CSA66_07545 [Proteobacteria bacterium]|nr:MAG: hypothetical protein CSA66_07545 [Pseudomonadota bacterium]
MTVLDGPMWSLRVEGKRVSIVLQGAPLPGSAEMSELVIHLPWVDFPFDFREGIERFRHHRGEADSLEVTVDARVLLDWLHRVSGGRLGGTANDDTLVLSGRTRHGARYTVRARIIADPEGDDDDQEPTLTLSLYQVRVYGLVADPWPVLAGRVIDLLPKELVVERSLTTARLRLVRPALAWALSALGWKLPEVRHLRARGVELRQGRLVARFVRAGGDAGPWLTLESMEDGGVRSSFERFVEDLELKRHHGQVDRLLAQRQIREALAEVYRALDGPPRPGFLAERLVGICASQPILYDEGERVCRELLRLTPNYEPALCGLASIALGRGRREETAVQLERLASVLTGPTDREDATAADLSVAELLRRAAPDEARAALERVLERSPDHEEALEALIAMSEGEGDLRVTLPLYKRLLFAARSASRTRDAGLRLARHAIERRQPEDARIFLRVVLETSPNDLEALLALAEVESTSGDDLEAARILDGALRAAPAGDGAVVVPVIERLATIALERLGDPGRARRVLWRAVDLATLDDAAALALGRLALQAAEPSLAERYLEAIPPDHASWAEAQSVRAEAALARGQAAEARQALAAALMADPSNRAALDLIERCAPEPSQRERLIHRLSVAAAKVSGASERARVLARVGALYESLGLGFDAIGPYEAALDQAPDSPEAVSIASHLIPLYATFGMWRKHQDLCRLRLTRHEEPEERVALLVRLGRVALMELSDPEQARPFLEEAARLAPRHLEALELLRATLESLERGIALVGVLLRLESVHPDDETRNAVRIRLGEAGQARATLGRLPAALADDPHVAALRRRAGLPGDDGPQGRGHQGQRDADAPGPDDDYGEALRLADRGELDAALAVLEGLLERHPGHVPAAELRGLLAEQPPALLRTERGPSRSPVVDHHPPRAAAPPVPPPIRAAGSQPSAQPAVERPAPSRPSTADLEPALTGPTEAAAPPANPPAGGSLDSAPPPGDAAPRHPQPRLPTSAAAETLATKAREADALETSMSEADAALERGDPAAALAALDHALDVDADFVPALELRVRVLRTLPDRRAHAQAIERLLDNVFDADRAADLLRELGLLLADHLDDPGGALERWRRYLFWRPRDAEIFERVAARLIERGELLDLAELYEREGESWEDEAPAEGGAPEISRRAATALTKAVALYEQAGRPALAVAAAERATSASPGDPEIMEVYARTLAAAERLGEARVVVEALAPMLLDGPHKDELLALVD